MKNGVGETNIENFVAMDTEVLTAIGFNYFKSICYKGTYIVEIDIPWYFKLPIWYYENIILGNVVLKKYKLQKFSKYEVKAAQCGNFAFFLPLRFSV